MKKFLSLMCAIAAALSAAVVSACNGGGSGVKVFVPDGAPALSVARLLSVDETFGEEVSYNVVSADEIASHVTYADKDKNADLCILPVNDAAALLGDGSRYKLLGAVTHGNLYILSADGAPALTRKNLAQVIAGKKVGVVQLPKFPGAVLKTVLSEYGVLSSVTLQGVQPAEVTGINSDCDYFVIPEPAASTRLNNPALKLNLAGSLQKLYSENGAGYPQAVLVAKDSFIKEKPEFIEKFLSSMKENADWLLSESVTSEDILSAVKKGYADPENTTPAFTAKTLTKSVIQNCAVHFSPASECKEDIITFLSKLKSVIPDSSGEVSDNFFYIK